MREDQRLIETQFNFLRALLRGSLLGLSELPASDGLYRRKAAGVIEFKYD